MEMILASGSPRRRELLSASGVPFRVFVPETEELSQCADYRSLALANAECKAETAAELFPGSLVLGADTVIELDHEILGKPSCADEAETMLLRLSGRAHDVVTGVCMVCRERNIRICFADLSRVVFRRIDLRTVREYMRLVPVLDKAGAYAVQNHAELIVERVEGSVSNVIGLPVERIVRTLSLNGLLRDLRDP